MPRSRDRFARQNRYRPPSAFPLTSPCPGIVHHLSGRTLHAQPHRYNTVGAAASLAGFTVIAFATPESRLQPLRLACKVHSLVRVSRRAADGRSTRGSDERRPDGIGKVCRRTATRTLARPPSFLQRVLPPPPAQAVSAGSTEARPQRSSTQQPLSRWHFHYCFNAFSMVAFHLSLAVLVCYRSRHHI